MMKIWSENNTLDPHEQTAGSAKKALWICALGHEWKARILNIKHGAGCRICNNKELLTGFNDLQTKFPEISKLYDEELNPLPSSQILSGSSKDYWFKCENHSHSYVSKIEKLKAGNRCSYCAGKKILKGFNDFPTTAPELLNWWDYDKNDSQPELFSKGSHKEAWWKCGKNHSFKKGILWMYSNPACGYCSNKVVLSGYNDIGTLRPDFLVFWDYDKNTLDPTQISPYTHVKFWVKCSLNHSWQTNGDKMSAGYRCPYCGGTRTLKGFNDLETKCPEMLKYWNYKRNKIQPFEISHMNNRKVWWICSKQHEWESIVSDISSGKSKCPICSNQRLLIGYNDLLTNVPDIYKYWSSENKKNPKEYTYKSGSYAKFICPLTKISYVKRICNFINSYPFCGCPDCTRATSKFEKEVNKFINDTLKTKTTTSNRTIISPKELDIVIESRKIAIECNGNYWHSDEIIEKRTGTSAKQFHQMKKDLAKIAGYQLFFVWEDDWKNKTEVVKTDLLNVLNNSSNVLETLNRLE